MSFGGQHPFPMESTCGNITASYRLPAEARESYSQAVLRLGFHWTKTKMELMNWFLQLMNCFMLMIFSPVTSTSVVSKRPRFWLQTLLARQPSERPTAAKLAHDVERYRLLGEACWRNRDMWKMVFEAVALEFGSHRCNT